jgi:hypothetical protein
VLKFDSGKYIFFAIFFLQIQKWSSLKVFDIINTDYMFVLHWLFQRDERTKSPIIMLILTLDSMWHESNESRLNWTWWIIRLPIQAQNEKKVIILGVGHFWLCLTTFISETTMAPDHCLKPRKVWKFSAISFSVFGC